MNCCYQQLNDLSGFLASAGTGNSVMTISINLNSSGVVYSWDNGVVDGNLFTPSSTNNYTVTATGPNGCSSTDDVTISIIPSPTVSAEVILYKDVKGKINFEIVAG